MTKQIVGIILMTIILAAGCFCLSVYEMSKSRTALNGSEDCRSADGFSIPSKCANAWTLGTVEELEFKSRVLGYCGLSFILVSAFLPILIYKRKTKSEKSEFNSILSI
ncbi:MAG: hypothetical protein ACR2HG_15300 [Pyrinomonadaceae bacterium]